MSDKPFTRPKVPEGKTEYVTTTWKTFQKEVPYSTPKKP